MTQSPYIMAYDMNVSDCNEISFSMLKSCVYEMKYGFIFLFTGVWQLYKTLVPASAIISVFTLLFLVGP